MRDRWTFGTARAAILTGLYACSALWPKPTDQRATPEEREASLSGIYGADMFRCPLF